MNTIVLTRTYAEPPFCEKEILRYAGCRDADSAASALLRRCVKEVRDKLIYRVCFRELSLSSAGGVCDFGLFRLHSKNLAQNLQGCKSAIVFAATVGIEIDRMIAKYGRISPSKALMLQAIGAERIEALCDAFCGELAEEKGALRPRFSPGYGDLPLAVQKELFAVLDCTKQIGLYLNDSLLMSPSKSVTAFAGVTDGATSEKAEKCSHCDNKDCSFRSTL